MADQRQPTPTPTSNRTRRTALAPDVRRLDERAARAWTERMAVRPLDDGRYAVDSEGGTYVVDPANASCTCPDHEIRGAVCKHLRRVAIEISTRRVPPPGKRRATCVACGVETFANEDADPPVLCTACRLEPGDVVRDREADRREASDRASGESEARRASNASGKAASNNGPASRETDDCLVVAAVTDRRADEVRVGPEDRPVADYESNAGYPDDDPVVEAVYLDDYAAGNPRRYSFPLSRLEPVDDAALVA